MRDNLLGRVFALASSEEQAEFLNQAGRMLRAVAESGGYDMQCCRIVDDLNGDGRALVKSIAEFIECDEQTPRVEHRVVYETEIRKREEEPTDA